MDGQSETAGGGGESSITDNGATSHMTPNNYMPYNLRLLSPEKATLYTGDGTPLAVVYVGIVDLLVHSKKRKRMSDPRECIACSCHAGQLTVTANCPGKLEHRHRCNRYLPVGWPSIISVG